MNKYLVTVEDDIREVRYSKVEAYLIVKAETAEEAKKALQTIIRNGELDDYVIEWEELDGWERHEGTRVDKERVTDVKFMKDSPDRGEDDLVDVDAKEVLGNA